MPRASSVALAVVGIAVLGLLAAMWCWPFFPPVPPPFQGPLSFWRPGVLTWGGTYQPAPGHPRSVGEPLIP